MDCTTGYIYFVSQRYRKKEKVGKGEDYWLEPVLPLTVFVLTMQGFFGCDKFKDLEHTGGDWEDMYS